MAHRLLSATRSVAPERMGAYQRAWGRVRAAAQETGAHAWLFRSAATPRAQRYLEFLEWPERAEDPTLHGPLGQAIDELNRAFPGDTEGWVEVMDPPSPEENAP